MTRGPIAKKPTPKPRPKVAPKPPRVELLELDPVPHMRPLRNDRCQQPTNSTGTPWYEDRKGQCARFARFKVGGRKLCAQHAGQDALQWLLEQSEGVK